MQHFDQHGQASGMKICFLAGTLEHGGAERQLFYIVQALQRLDAAVRVLCLDRGQFWEEPIRSLGVPVTWVGRSGSRIGRAISVVKEVRKDLPHLLQSQHFFANAYVALAAFLLRIRGIGAMRNEGAAELRNNGLSGGWLNLRLPGTIAANSRLAIQQAIELGVSASRLHFLPNVVDTGRFRPAECAEDRPLTYISVGRLASQKRFDRFISALARLRIRTNCKVRGWIVGPESDNALREDLQSKAAHYGLIPDCLEFLGGVSNMVHLYQQADVCVLTSDYEGTPNVLLEAMACGLPVIATKVGGVPDVVEHGKSGFLLQPDDSNGLVAAMARLADDEPLRVQMGRSAREYVQQNHSVERLPGYLEELYRFALPRQDVWTPAILERTAV